MAEIDWLFPKAESQPIMVREALNGIERLSGPMPVPGTKIYECCNRMKQGQTASDYYKRNWGFNLFRLHWDKPSPTFTKGGGACGLIHPELARKCIKEEYQAVMSFPRKFIFVGTEDNARARIGNSVPPLFMRAIVANIRKIILDGKVTWRPNRNMDYVSILEEAWQQHLASREPSAPTVISTFAGAVIFVILQVLDVSISNVCEFQFTSCSQVSHGVALGCLWE